MKKRRVALGPGAASLILIVVVLGMCMLSVLTLISAGNDEKLCARGADMISNVYSLSAMSENTLAELSDIIADEGFGSFKEKGNEKYISKKLPASMIVEDDLVSWVETENGRTMDCAVRVVENQQGTEFRWIRHNVVTEDEGEF